MNRLELLTLPAGTRFMVYNGAWEGEIIEIEGNKYVRTELVNKARIHQKEFLELTILTANEDSIGAKDIPYQPIG